MTPKDRAVRQAALTRLAVATRERLPETREDREAFFSVYLSDLEGYSAETFVRACRHLETAVSWFPKKHELAEACRSIARQQADARKPSLALLPGDRPVDPEKLMRFKEAVAEAIASKAMDTIAAKVKR